MYHSILKKFHCEFTCNLIIFWYVCLLQLKVIFFNFCYLLGTTLYSCQREHSCVSGKGTIWSEYMYISRLILALWFSYTSERINMRLEYGGREEGGGWGVRLTFFLSTSTAILDLLCSMLLLILLKMQKHSFLSYFFLLFH